MGKGDGSFTKGLITKKKRNYSHCLKFRGHWGAVLSAPPTLAELRCSPEILGIYCDGEYCSERVKRDKGN